jgi:poly(glycerol-phosphate) alpha-glucosyltransferase
VTSLPLGRHFAVTWSIPDDFGGMTSALLHRSRAFVKFGRVAVDVLTFDARPDYPDLDERLRERGELVEGMRLLNLYEWLRTHPLPGGTLRPDLHPFTPLDLERGEADTTNERDGHIVSATRLSDDGETVLQVDHYRDDGTLLLTDRRDVRVAGELGGRSIVLCDEVGRPVRSWGRAHRFYRAWLDRLTAKKISYMIVDSKTAANFMVGYHRPHVVISHVIHGSHLAVALDPASGVRESRRAVFEQLEGFDGVVALTERQRRDMLALRPELENVDVVPNSRDRVASVRLDRDPTAGVVLAALTARKRVDHAIDAVVEAHATSGATLEVFGDGELRTALDARAGEHTDAVTMRGYRSDARESLSRASFLLLTATSEGFPLVLVESMAAGCIPIAYDVPYGPGDVIDGRNGLLVPAGDRAALRAAVEEVASASPQRLASMRRHARATARRFTDRAVTDQWARQLRLAARRHARRVVPPRAPGDATVAPQPRESIWQEAG